MIFLVARSHKFSTLLKEIGFLKMMLKTFKKDMDSLFPEGQNGLIFLKTILKEIDAIIKKMDQVEDLLEEIKTIIEEEIKKTK